jgi:hypothetical protein
MFVIIDSLQNRSTVVELCLGVMRELLELRRTRGMTSVKSKEREKNTATVLYYVNGEYSVD